MVAAGAVKAGARPLAWAVLVLLAAGYFYQGGGWNQNSRYDLARAIVERGTLRIDAYHGNTGDKSRVDGHYYSDKAPGAALVATPVVAVGAIAANLAGTSLDSRRATAATSYAATVFTSALPLVGIALLLVFIGRRFEHDSGAIQLAVLGTCLATPLWAYSTLFMGHTLAAFALLAAAAFAWDLPRQKTDRRVLVWASAVGFGCGWAVVTEYTAIVPAALIYAFALFPLRHDHRRLIRALVAATAAAGICAAVLFTYHYLAFGSPLATPLEHLVLFREVREKPFGWPKLGALRAIFLGSKRGLVPLAPIVLFGVFGLVLMVRDRAARRLGALCAAIVLYYALVNASFATPLAGWSYGPRYMAAALPFWGIGLLWAWRFKPPLWWKALVIAALGWGLFCGLVAVSTTAQPPESFARPFYELWWPAFADGDLALGHQSFLEAAADPRRLRDPAMVRDSWNLGQLVGLGGRLSLIPLLVAAIALLIPWRQWTR